MGNDLVLPVFSGSGYPTAEVFDSTVRALAKEHDWNSRETALNAIRCHFKPFHLTRDHYCIHELICSAFEGPALDWFEKSSRKNNLLEKDWEILRQSLLQKFGRQKRSDIPRESQILEPKVSQFSGQLWRVVR
jgi:hypothetical protein